MEFKEKKNNVINTELNADLSQNKELEKNNGPQIFNAQNIIMEKNESSINSGMKQGPVIEPQQKVPAAQIKKLPVYMPFLPVRKLSRNELEERRKMFNEDEKNAHAAALEKLGYKAPTSQAEAVALRTNLSEAVTAINEEGKTVTLDYKWADNVSEELRELVNWMTEYFKIHNDTIEEFREEDDKTLKMGEYDVAVEGLDEIYENQGATLNCYCCSGTAMLNQYLRNKNKEEKPIQRFNQTDLRNYRPRVKKYRDEFKDFNDKDDYTKLVREIDQYAGKNKTSVGNVFHLGDFFLDKLKGQNAQLNKMYIQNRVATKKDEKTKQHYANNIKAVFAAKINEVISTGNVVSLLMSSGNSGHYITITGIHGNNVEVLDSFMPAGKQKDLRSIDSLMSGLMTSGKSLELTWISDMGTPEQMQQKYSNLTYDKEKGYGLKVNDPDNAQSPALSQGIAVRRTMEEMGPGTDGISEVAYIPNPLAVQETEDMDEYLKNAAKEEKALKKEKKENSKKTEKETDKERNKETDNKDAGNKTEEKPKKESSDKPKEQTEKSGKTNEPAIESKKATEEKKAVKTDNREAKDTAVTKETEKKETANTKKEKKEKTIDKTQLKKTVSSLEWSDIRGPLTEKEKKEQKARKKSDRKILSAYEKKSEDYASFGVGFDLEQVKVNAADSKKMADIKRALKYYLEIKQSILKRNNLRDMNSFEYSLSTMPKKVRKAATPNIMALGLTKDTNDASLIGEESDARLFTLGDVDRDELGEAYDKVFSCVQSYLLSNQGFFKFGRGRARLKQVEYIKDSLKVDNMRFMLSSSRRELLNSLDTKYERNRDYEKHQWEAYRKQLMPTWLHATVLNDYAELADINHKRRREVERKLNKLPGIGSRIGDYLKLKAKNFIRRAGAALAAGGGLIDRGLGLATMIAANSLELSGKVIKAPFKLLSSVFNLGARVVGSRKRWRMRYSLTKGWKSIDDGRQIFRRYLKGAFILPAAVWETVTRGFPYVFAGHHFKHGVYKRTTRWSKDIWYDVKKSFESLYDKRYYVSKRAKLDYYSAVTEDDYENEEEELTEEEKREALAAMKKAAEAREEA